MVQNRIVEKKKFDIHQISKYFVSIPSGQIMMRDDRTKKSWLVDIKSFELSKFPVTQEFYQALMNMNPSTFVGNELPVESVSWLDAVNFCNSLSDFLGKDKCYSPEIKSGIIKFNAKANGFRLATEAEWQFACQAGKKEIRHGELDKIAWYKNNSNNQTRRVGQKAPNDWGLYDMLGNVWEWCSDIYDETVYGSYRIFRGGGWFDEERSIMATNRRRSHPSLFKIDDLGFRIATNSKIEINSMSIE